MFTHLIRGFAQLRYVQSHHAATKTNKCHAIADPDLVVRGYATAAAVCGGEITIREYEDSYTPTYNCRAATSEDSRFINCAKCRKVLGLPSLAKRK